MRSSRGGQPHGLIVGNMEHNRDILSYPGKRSHWLPFLGCLMVSSQTTNNRKGEHKMFRVTIRGFEVTCESTQEIVALVLAASIPEVKQTRPTPPRATKSKGRKQPTAAQKKARAKKAREGYKAKQEAKKKAPLDLTAPAPTLPAPATTAETHHGTKEKQHRADTSGEVIAALRRSGLALTIPEIHDDLKKAGWKYVGDNPLNAIRSTLNRLGAKGTVARGHNAEGADITFMIARVEHDDPLPHQQRESDV